MSVHPPYKWKYTKLQATEASDGSISFSIPQDTVWSMADSYFEIPHGSKWAGGRLSATFAGGIEMPIDIPSHHYVEPADLRKRRKRREKKRKWRLKNKKRKQELKAKLNPAINELACLHRLINREGLAMAPYQMTLRKWIALFRKLSPFDNLRS